MRRTIFASIAVCCALSVAVVEAQDVTAGAADITGEGMPDGGTNILYINEAIPFDFGPGNDHGILTNFRFWVHDGRVAQGMVTPFVAEPLIDEPVTGDDFVIRAIGTTREAVLDWQCGGLYQYPFHETEQFTVQSGWVAGLLTSDPLGERADALSPIPFTSGGPDGWLTYAAAAGSGTPAIELNEPILEGNSGTDVNAFGFREYQFQLDAVPGDIQPPLDPGGRVGEACPGPPPGNIAGAEPIQSDGVVDTWTNVLYINEEQPFDFAQLGADSGLLDVVSFYVGADSAQSGMVTPFIAEPLVDNPQTGDDFVVRAIGTTREGGIDWEDEGVHIFPFSDTETFEVQSGWVAGFLSSDPLSESDLAGSPIPFVGNAGDNGWLTGTNSAASGAPSIAINEPIVQGLTGTDVNAYGLRRYQFQVVASVGPPAEPGDFNGDGVLSAQDIDLLTVEVLAGSHADRFDLNADSLVDESDRTVWVEQLRNTYFGDADLDGVFDSTDLVQVLSLGKYEDTTEDNAGWADGDWDGDLDFTTTDFVIALAGGGYEAGPRAAVHAVPEPSSCLLLVVGWMLIRFLHGRFVASRRD